MATTLILMTITWGWEGLQTQNLVLIMGLGDTGMLTKIRLKWDSLAPWLVFLPYPSGSQMYSHSSGFGKNYPLLIGLDLWTLTELLETFCFRQETRSGLQGTMLRAKTELT